MSNQLERRDLTPRGRFIREWVEEACAEGFVALVGVPGLARFIARIHDEAYRMSQQELVAEFQAVITKLRADITQDKPS